MIGEDILAFHHRVTVVDAHCDTVLSLADTGRRLGPRSDQGQVDLDRLAEGGVDVQFFAVCTQPRIRPEGSLLLAVRLLERLLAEIDSHATRVGVARSAADLEALAVAGRLAAVLALEGGEPLQGDLAVLNAFHRLGVRAITLTWNLRNDLADGVMERSGSGLTGFGLEVVEEMKRLGMLVDVSHLCVRAFWDVLEQEPPVIASHSAASALCPHPRNLTDDQLRGLAAQGGVVGVTFMPALIDSDPARADLDRVADHILHIAAVAGPEHVGLGSDFDGMGRGPRGLEDATCFPALTARLFERGLSHREVEGILGRNFLRALQQIRGE